MRFDPFTTTALEDPYVQYSRFREEAPVHWSEKLRSWVLFRHDDVTAFFLDDERLSSDRSKATKFRGSARSSEIGVRTVSTDPPVHGPVRALLNGALNPRVRTIGPRVDELVRVLLERLDGAVRQAVDDARLEGEADLITEFAFPLPINVIAELFGVPEEDRGQFRGWSHGVARSMDRFYSGDGVSRGLAEMHGYFAEMVAKRKGQSGDDLIHRLLAAENRGDSFAEMEVIAMCSTLVFAGHETTVNLIGNGMLALLRNRRELERLCAEPALAEKAIEELLRFDSPAQMISRTAVADFEIRGQSIRAGDSVLAAVGSANRDPEAFADPDRLDVGRHPNDHLAFGLGIHFCPGAALSRIEARAAIPALLARFPRIRQGAAPHRWRATAVLRGLECLPVRTV
jgi:pimeloyl-[acyl-carrier protein] synthase